MGREPVGPITRTLLPGSPIHLEIHRLGDIPKVMQVKRISEVLRSLLDGHTLHHQWGEGPVFLGSRNLPERLIDLSEIKA